MGLRGLSADRRARIHVFDVTTGIDSVVYETDSLLLEAPNWARDGTLFLNGAGTAWTLSLDSGELRPVPFEGLPEINNDHVLDPRGHSVYMSAQDGQIYRGALDGGAAERVTPDAEMLHFLHGISPDGDRLAYVRMKTFSLTGGRLAVLHISSGAETVLDTGDGHVDGPEWSPDGEWIYFNTERWADRPGHAQIARIPDGGGPVDRVTSGDTVDWFPHFSPDGGLAVYLEYPIGTIGHPPNVDVQLVVVSPDAWDTPLARVSLHGGQGTINVNSWAPDSRRFAYVSYPIGA